MMLRKLLQPWWSNLIEGLFFILMSFIIMSNPIQFLETIALWLGILVFLAGLSGIGFYLVSKAEKKSLVSLITSIVITLLGLLMISRIGITEKAITVIFGLLITVAGINIIIGSLKARKGIRLWWIPLLIGILAVGTGVQSMLRIQEGANALTTLIGVSLLIAGAGLVVLALMKKRLQD
jgi:uncharacterized membrane protein HdeD (DUF308 family)